LNPEPNPRKVATSDQPESIVRDIEEMVKRFITPRNVLHLPQFFTITNLNP
jgi:hypothetical protein